VVEAEGRGHGRPVGRGSDGGGNAGRGELGLSVRDVDGDEARDLLQRDAFRRAARKVSAQPTVGCPAKGISAFGVKMRTLAVWAGSSGVWTKIVSDRLNCRAMVCICAGLNPSAPSTMASGLPVKGVAVKTS
jgi:hypothetical protein